MAKQSRNGKRLIRVSVSVCVCGLVEQEVAVGGGVTNFCAKIRAYLLSCSTC